jgi:hypothetical protein
MRRSRVDMERQTEKFWPINVMCMYVSTKGDSYKSIDVDVWKRRAIGYRQYNNQ